MLILAMASCYYQVFSEQERVYAARHLESLNSLTEVWRGIRQRRVVSADEVTQKSKFTLLGEIGSELKRKL